MSLVATGAVIVLATIAVTAVRYRDLPPTIPIHFGIDGSANGYAPRPLVWLLVGIQLLLGATYAAIDATARLPGLLIVGDCVAALCFWGQVQIISAAVNGSNRIPMGRFWIGFSAILIAGAVGTYLAR